MDQLWPEGCGQSRLGNPFSKFSLRPNPSRDLRGERLTGVVYGQFQSEPVFREETSSKSSRFAPRFVTSSKQHPSGNNHGNVLNHVGK